MGVRTWVVVGAVGGLSTGCAGMRGVGIPFGIGGGVGNYIAQQQRASEAEQAKKERAANEAAANKALLDGKSAFVAKDCKDLGLEDLNALTSAEGAATTKLSEAEVGDIGLKLLACGRNEVFFESHLTRWQAREPLASLPPKTNWFGAFASYVKTAKVIFNDQGKDGGLYAVGLERLVKQFEADHKQADACTALMGARTRVNPNALDAVLNVCTQAARVEAVSVLVNELLTSENHENRTAACRAVANLPKAANKKVVKVIDSMKWSDPYRHETSNWLVSYPVRDACQLASQKVALAE